VAATRICPGKHCTAARRRQRLKRQSLNLEIHLGALHVGSRFGSQTSRVRHVDVEGAARTCAVPRVPSGPPSGPAQEYIGLFQLTIPGGTAYRTPVPPAVPPEG